MICLKFLMYSMGGTAQIGQDQPDYEARLKRVVIFYNEMVLRDGEKLAYDDSFLFMAEFFFSQEFDKRRDQLYQPLSKSKISPKNALTYLDLMKSLDEFQYALVSSSND